MAKLPIPLLDLPVIGRSVDGHFDNDIFNKGALILMDKPREWSSFQVVKFVRNRVPPKKVGHAGTLDPLATGLLVLCTGKATKSISQIQDLPKTYVTTVRFGASTPSYDAAVEPDHTAAWEHVTQNDIEEILVREFTGSIYQKPPIYSAVKVKGQRLYKLARRGEEVDIEPRKAMIHSIDLLDCNMPDISLKIICGKGTYIRSLVHDLGIALQSRAFVTALRRTQTGHFHVNDARTPEEFEKFVAECM